MSLQQFHWRTTLTGTGDQRVSRRTLPPVVADHVVHPEPLGDEESGAALSMRPSPATEHPREVDVQVGQATVTWTVLPWAGQTR